MILGNHFNKYTVHTRYYGKMDISDEEIISYKNDLLKALDTNLFSYVAHPDLFMVGKVYFDELCENITREICQKALEKDVPLYQPSLSPEKGYRVSYARIGSAILDTDGVEDYEGLTVNGGTANLTVPAKYAAVLGEVSVSYAE